MLINFLDIIFANVVVNLGYIVHHKKYITSKNVFNPEVAINFDNLELLCIDCHNKEHFADDTFDCNGELNVKKENILKLAGIF